MSSNQPRPGAATLPSGSNAPPTLPRPEPGGLGVSLRRNIRALEERARHEAAAANWEAHLAQAITDFTGSMRFVYVHLVLYGAWIVANLIPGLPHFDPSFVILAMVASVEAIFLSTFVLISQNRTAAAAKSRAELDLQISLLAEHELTELARLVGHIAERLDISPDAEPGFSEITRDVAPEAVLDEIDRQENGEEASGKTGGQP